MTRIVTDNLGTSKLLIILILIFRQWHLITLTMSTLTVIKNFDVFKNIASRFISRSVELFLNPFAFQ